MKKIIFVVFLITSLWTFSQPPVGYYDGTAGLTGYALKTKVHEIISKNYNWHYGDLQEYYKQTDLDLYYDYNPGNNPSSGNYILLDIYSEIPNGTDSYEYNSTQLIGSSGTEGNGWNREHMMPQSTFSTGSISNYPMYSDLFYVIPADARINQLRSNYPYGVAGTTVYHTFSNGSKIGNDATPGYAYTGRVYEPIDEFKGDVARSLLYFIVRYEGKLNSFNYSPGTTVANDTNPLDGTEERGYDPAYISMLKQWHIFDPVSPREIDRNNAVYNIQKNRNPFIDHPAWVGLMWPDVTDVVAPSSPTNLTVTQQNAHFVNLSWTPSSDTDILGYKIYMNGSTDPVATTRNTNVVIDRLSPSTTYTFTVKSYDQGYLESPQSNIATANTLVSDGFAKELMMTKYLEGTSNNKAIEITNKTGHEVHLNNYNLNIQFYNGTNYYFSDSFQLEGKVADGETFVVLNPNAAFSCYGNSQAKFVTASTPLTFTGGQYVELAFKGNTTVDGIGLKDTGNSNGNVSLYRKNTINQPNTTFNIAEWDAYPSNYCQNLGVSLETVEAFANHASNFMIYPVPASDEIYVKGKDFRNIQVARIIDFGGRQMMELKNPFSYRNYLSISHLKSGNYLLQLDDETFKFIKK